MSGEVTRRKGGKGSSTNQPSKSKNDEDGGSPSKKKGESLETR